MDRHYEVILETFEPKPGISGLEILHHSKNDGQIALRELAGFTAIHEEQIRNGKVKVYLSTYTDN